MKLYLKRKDSNDWILRTNITKYSLSEEILSFCDKYNIRTCDFKIEGTVNIKSEIEGLPALFV